MLIVVLVNKFVRFTSGRKCLLIPNQFNKSPPTFCLCKSINKIWEVFHCSLRFFAKKQSQTNAIKFLLVLIFFKEQIPPKNVKKESFLRHRILPLTFGCCDILLRTKVGLRTSKIFVLVLYFLGNRVDIAFRILSDSQWFEVGIRRKMCQDSRFLFSNFFRNIRNNPLGICSVRS